MTTTTATGDDWRERHAEHCERKQAERECDRQNGEARRQMTEAERLLVLNAEPDVLDAANPKVTARLFVQRFYFHANKFRTLHFDGGEWWGWVEGHGMYEKVPAPAIRAALYGYLELCVRLQRMPDGDDRQVPFKPNKNHVDHIIDALKAECMTRATPPCWIMRNAAALPAVADLIVARNLVAEVKPDGSWQTLTTPHPTLFVCNALQTDLKASAPKPVQFLEFLNLLWPDDPQCIRLLQEFAGYLLTSDTHQQKMLLLVGPKRAGKGVICRLLTALIGAANVCAPTLSGLTSLFGIWGLLDKSLAIIADARLSNRADLSIVCERLLALTGEDSIEFHRKNLPPVTARPNVRIIMATNELPRMNDASGALANRFLVLRLEKSFLGREDTKLTDRLLGELSGILAWALEGLQRLRQRGHFVQPDSGNDAIAELEALASPVTTFIEDWTVLEPAAETPARDLFCAWSAWCDENGARAGTQQVFGRDLRAAVPRICMTRHNDDGARTRVYSGIRLTAVAQASADQWRAKHDENNKPRATAPGQWASQPYCPG